MPWRFSDDVEPYAERAVPLLSRDPAAHTIGLSIIDALRSGHRFGDEPMYFGWLEQDGEVRGAVSRTPPYDLLLSVVPDAESLVPALREHGLDVPGVNGEVELVEQFAAVWTAGTDLQSTTFLQLRLFALGELEPPDPPPPGRPRLAGEADFDLSMRWFDAFSEELNLPERMPEPRVHAMIAERMLWLWANESGAPAALALRTQAAAGVARINCVYTPPDQRGRGFGGAVTATCSADALAREAEHVVLFTDVNAPGPNKVYQRIGFRPQADHRVVHFNSQPPSRGSDPVEGG